MLRLPRMLKAKESSLFQRIVVFPSNTLLQIASASCSEKSSLPVSTRAQLLPLVFDRVVASATNSKPPDKHGTGTGTESSAAICRDRPMTATDLRQHSPGSRA
eukprot:scaffold970_cov412-Prasinococcus_capsulatus_cf.AAC.6